MPDHEPFDGTVPPAIEQIKNMPTEELRRELAKRREAMNYATKEDHR